MYIQSLEQSPPSNELVGEIISESLENRILTYYTAFLTLEPGMVVEEIDEEDQFNEVAVLLMLKRNCPRWQLSHWQPIRIHSLKRSHSNWRSLQMNTMKMPACGSIMHPDNWYGSLT